jgi:hypothetical protein
MRTVTTAPFFIIGSGRSGTTLLRMILASHSRLSIPPETWYLLRLGELLDIRRPLTPDEIVRVTQIMTDHYRWADMNFDASDFRRQVADLGTPYLRDVVELVYQNHLHVEHKSRWGDKTPGYIEIAPQLAALFPGAKFVHFVRDGRDVAKSFQSLRWAGRWLHDNTREWVEAMDYNQRWIHSTLSGQIFQARYEDLVLDTERTIREICKFLGEEFEPGMLSWQEKVDGLMPAREVKIHEKLKHIPDSTFIFRWKREMSIREMLVSEAFMGNHLGALGYELRFRNPGWAPILGLTRWYCLSVLPLLGLPLKAARIFMKRIIRQHGARGQN